MLDCYVAVCFFIADNDLDLFVHQNVTFFILRKGKWVNLCIYLFGGFDKLIHIWNGGGRVEKRERDYGLIYCQCSGGGVVFLPLVLNLIIISPPKTTSHF